MVVFFWVSIPRSKHALWIPLKPFLYVDCLQNNCNLLARLLWQTRCPNPPAGPFIFHPFWNGCMVLYNMHLPCDGAMVLEKYVKISWTMDSMEEVKFIIQPVIFLGEFSVSMGNTYHGTNTRLLKYPCKPFWQGLLEIKNHAKCMKWQAAKPFDKGGKAAGYWKGLQTDLQSTLLSRLERPLIWVARNICNPVVF